MKLLTAILMLLSYYNSEIEGSNKEAAIIDSFINVATVVSVEKRPEIDGIPLSNEILDYIWYKSKQYNISYELVLAISKVESNYGQDLYNKNKNGTYDSGIMQINNTNIRWLSELAGIKNPDPMNHYHNIDMALALLDYERNFWLKKGYSEEETFWLTIYSYHRGRGNALKMASKNEWKSKYVDAVIQEKERLEMMQLG